MSYNVNAAMDFCTNAALGMQLCVTSAKDLIRITESGIIGVTIKIFSQRLKRNIALKREIFLVKMVCLD